MNKIFQWQDENPVGYGIHWLCPMEVAIRSANWLVGWEIVKRDGELPVQTKKVFFDSIYKAGIHIEQNLEISVKKPLGNHYLSDLAGLFFIGLLAVELREAARWRRFALREMERCIRSQVFTDGVYFENSISYHRFALEIYLYAAIWGQKHGLNFSQEYKRRLELMIEFVRHYTRPDGKIPNFGDADDGIWFAFDDKVLEHRADHRYLLALGAVLFKRGDFKALASDERKYVERVFGDEGIAAWDSIENTNADLSSQDFPAGGFYFMRSGEAYMAVIAANRHPSGYQAHKHNDVFSFELCIGDAPFIIDSGTYIYTKDPKARNYFRSAAAHNTVVVDSMEPNSLSKKGFFALPREARVEVQRWETSPQQDRFEGILTFSAAADSFITHKRGILFDKKKNEWEITDTINGRGRHCCVSYIHFHPETRLEHREQTITCRLRDRILSLKFDGSVSISVTSRDVSLKYGEKTQAPCVTATIEETLPVRFSLRMSQVYSASL